MADERDGNQQAPGRQDATKPDVDITGDLDARPEEIEKVKGGRARAEDPCAGGEIRRP